MQFSIEQTYYILQVFQSYTLILTPQTRHLIPFTVKDWQVSCSCLILTLLGQQPGFNELQAIFYKSHRPTEGPVKYL